MKNNIHHRSPLFARSPPKPIWILERKRGMLYDSSDKVKGWENYGTKNGFYAAQHSRCIVKHSCKSCAKRWKENRKVWKYFKLCMYLCVSRAIGIVFRKTNCLRNRFRSAAIENYNAEHPHPHQPWWKLFISKRKLQKDAQWTNMIVKLFFSDRARLLDFDYCCFLLHKMECVFSIRLYERLGFLTNFHSKKIVKIWIFLSFTSRSETRKFPEQKLPEKKLEFYRCLSRMHRESKMKMFLKSLAIFKIQEEVEWSNR